MYTVARIGPGTVGTGIGSVDFGMQTAVHACQEAVELLHIGLGKPHALDTQDIHTLPHTAQQGIDELLCMGGAILLGVGVLLGTVLVGSHITAVGQYAEGGASTVVYHPLHPELRTAPQRGEGTQKELLIEGEAVVLPQMAAIPGIGHEVVVAPQTHAAEDVVLCEAGPSVLHASKLCGGTLPVVASGHIDDVVDEGQMQLAQVGGLGWPIVHLHVDVGMDIGVPGRLTAVVPYTLQVAGDIHTATATDHEIASIGEVELFEEEGIGLAACGTPAGIIVALYQAVGGKGRSGSLQLEIHSSAQCREVLGVALEQSRPPA